MRNRALAIIASLLTVIGFVAWPGQAMAEPTNASELKASVLARGSQAFASRAAMSGGAGNGIFQVYVEHNSGLGQGSFTVLTGPNNPAGAGLNVLFGNGVPGTSYMIVRDTAPDGTSVDYVQGNLLTHDNEVSLDNFGGYTEALGTTGFRTTWFHPSFGRLVQDIIVHGTTQADSRVEVSTTISPKAGYEDHTFTVQYLWDVAIGEDDGPALQPQQATTVYRPYSPVETRESTVVDDSLVVVDNDSNAVPPNLAVGVSANGPSWVSPTAPDFVNYVCWPSAIYSPIGEYQIDDTYDIGTPASTCTNSDGEADAAIQSVWSVEASAEPTTVSASLFMSPRTPYPTTMTATPVLLRTPVFSATLSDSVKPLAGKTVQFLVGNTVRCTAVTDVNGKAGCGTLIDRLIAVLSLGYTARYSGGAIWGPSSAKGGLL